VYEAAELVVEVFTQQDRAETSEITEDQEAGFEVTVVKGTITPGSITRIGVISINKDHTEDPLEEIEEEEVLIIMVRTSDNLITIRTRTTTKIITQIITKITIKLQ